MSLDPPRQPTRTTTLRCSKIRLVAVVCSIGLIFENSGILSVESSFVGPTKALRTISCKRRRTKIGRDAPCTIDAVPSSRRGTRSRRNRGWKSFLQRFYAVSNTTSPLSAPLLSTIEPISAKVLNKSIQSQREHSFNQADALMPLEAENMHGMPWSTSIGNYTYADSRFSFSQNAAAANRKQSSLVFMAFWQHQLSLMKSTLTNLKTISVPDCFAYIETPSEKRKKARIVNTVYQSDEYRKIRMLYYDGRDDLQVFSSLWYPCADLVEGGRGLPLLGVDFLAFGRKVYLTIMDFQPLTDDDKQEDYHYAMLEQAYKDLPLTLRGRMSERFYDESQFFSKNMLFGRFQQSIAQENVEKTIIYSDLWEAFHKYLAIHMDMVQAQFRKQTSSACSQDSLMERRRIVMEGQRKYDIYSAGRDPAHALLKGVFGEEWADRFIYDYLFDLSRKDVTVG